jgi:hypothetical protein
VNRKLKLLSVAALFLAFSSSAFCASGKELAGKLKINAGDKAMKQWERVFSNPDKLKEIGAGGLSDGDKSALKAYLLEYAADGDKPAAAGK